MVAEIWASVISSFVDQLVALKNLDKRYLQCFYVRGKICGVKHTQKLGITKTF